MAQELNWERVYEIPFTNSGTSAVTFKAKVPGGWLYRHVSTYAGGDNPKINETMVFVPENKG